MKIPVSFACIVAACGLVQAKAPASLIHGPGPDGRIAVEAEHFYKATKKKVRSWELTTTAKVPNIKPDGDPSHAEGASGGAYLEALPDTRRSHGDTLKHLENFSPEPGKMAILSYKVHFPEPGRYYVWVRTFSTNTEDNGIHVGLNGKWPESGARMQWITKNKWHWASKQRTAKVHIGVEGKIWLDVPKKGTHRVEFSMREDGFEFDKFMLTRKQGDRPQGMGPDPVAFKGRFPKLVEAKKAEPKKVDEALVLSMSVNDFPMGKFYKEHGKWLALHPDKHKEASVKSAFPHPAGSYDVTIHAIGENDGQSTYGLSINGRAQEDFTPPLSQKSFEEGPAFTHTWKGLSIQPGDVIEVSAKIGSADGKEWARARWSGLSIVPADEPTIQKVLAAKTAAKEKKKNLRREGVALFGERQANGDGSVAVSGALTQWQPVTLTLDGPFAHELDKMPNPFSDYKLTAYFRHESGSPFYEIPGYFAADGNAGETSAQSGTKWRAHLSPDKPGKWTYALSLTQEADVAMRDPKLVKAKSLITKRGEFTVAAVDKSAPGFYSRGRLSYVGKRYLQFAGDKSYFFKAGADAPETLLAFIDFDGTETRKKKAAPLKAYASHVKDWRSDSISWKGGKGKGLVGALDYLADKGANAFSFLTYNAGGDGDNVWPFTSRDAKFHYDCSKLDQWNAVFTHAQKRGLHLHFKTQETENDDLDRGHGEGTGITHVPTALDEGDLGPERALYYRELVARFGHHLALCWNVGEENTQSYERQRKCAEYIGWLDAYDHNIVLHTFPGQQNRKYRPHLGKPTLSGLSLQNDWTTVHQKTHQWVTESLAAGRPWVVCNDEQGTADTGCPPDTGYRGFTKAKDKNRSWDMHDFRKSVLWGNLMAGGAGVEYYFGYALPENDLKCEDWRSRDKSWEFAGIAIDFFESSGLPFEKMVNRDELVNNKGRWNRAYCMASEDTALVYLSKGGEQAFDFSPAKTVTWFNPRTGETFDPVPWKNGHLKAPNGNDWLAILK